MNCSIPVFHTINNSRSLLKFMSIELVMPTNQLILCHPLLLLPSIFPSIKVFSNELILCIRWSNYWSFSFSISPSNEYSELISFRIDWFDPLVVQRTLKSLFQHNCLKASILSKVQMCKQKSNAHFRILWSVKEKKWVIEKEIEGQ